MAIPPKGLKLCNLRHKTAGKALNDGSHQIYEVVFIENNEEKRGFYKELEPQNHYPELLAKISVAVSTVLRIFHGKNCAEERLVFDNDGKIVGTLSISLDNFKSFLFANETTPADPKLEAQVIPTTDTLLAINALDTMVGRWWIYDDDFHPHNWGRAGNHTAHLDFDMALYEFSVYMKNPRPTIGVPNQRVNLTVRDWHEFPNIRDAKPYHFPSYNHPGQESVPTVIPGAQSSVLPSVLPKAYKAPQHFQLLAKNPLAHEQKLAAALKILLTYNLDTVRARLNEMFGDISLNYTSLGELSRVYNKNFPHLCNLQTDKKPFIDFIMQLFQAHYDNLYRVVVYDIGCQNNKYGVALPATHQALSQKPSLYRTIEGWITEQNEGLLKNEEAGVKYNLAGLQKRYHQVWRDAFAPEIRQVLKDCYQETGNLYKIASHISSLQPYSCKESTDDTITNSWSFFGDMPLFDKEVVVRNIKLHEDNKLRDALFAAIDMTHELYHLTKDYYSKSYVQLDFADSKRFADEIDRIRNQYEMAIRSPLSYTSEEAKQFNLIFEKLRAFAHESNIIRHLTQTDEQVKESNALVTHRELTIEDKQVQQEFCNALFSWAASKRAREFENIIIDITDNHYASFIQASYLRTRGEQVKHYLKRSSDEANDLRLAYILSSGSSDDGALNQAIIKYLTPQLINLQHFACVRNEIKDNKYTGNLLPFIKASTYYAKTQFNHLYSKSGINLFYDTLFTWIKRKKQAEFTGLVKSALYEYEQGLSSLKSAFTWLVRQDNSRREEVLRTCNKEANPAKALAIILVNGKDSSSFNQILFAKIIESIHENLRKNPALASNPGYALVATYDAKEHKDFFMKNLKKYAAHYSFEESKAPIASAAAALS